MYIFTYMCTHTLTVGFVKLNNLYYAGSHGFDIQGPSQLSLKQVATDYIPSLTSFKNVRTVL